MWTPKEVRKTVGLIFGLGFVVWGAMMMMNNISAKGTIELKTSIMEGKMESGSAGLFLAIIGLFITAFSMLKAEESSIKNLKNNKVILAICILIFFVFSIVIYILFPNSTLIIGFTIPALAFPFFLLIRSIIQE